MKALQVLIDDEIIGKFVPPKNGCFAANLGNVPRKYMRAFITGIGPQEKWHWQLPDVREGQTIAFRMVDAEPDSGVPPQRIRQIQPEVAEKTRKLASVMMKRALKEQAVEKKKIERIPTKRRKAKDEN